MMPKHVQVDAENKLPPLDGSNLLNINAGGAHTHTASNITDFLEAVQDAVAGMLGAGSNVILNYDDTAGTLSIAATGAGGTGLSAEEVRDAIGVALVGVGLISVTVNDVADTITFTTTATQNSSDSALRDRTTHTGVQPATSITQDSTHRFATDTEKSTWNAKQAAGDYATNAALTSALSGKSDTLHSHTSTNISDFTEAVQDAVAALLGAGSNVVLNYNDASNSLSISATSSGGTGLDAEQVRDAIGVALVGVGNITVTVNDAADTITFSTTATVNSTDAALRDRATHTGNMPAANVTEDATHRFATDAEKTTWNGKQASGDYATNTALGTKADKLALFDTVSGDYTAVLTDSGRIKRMNSATANKFIVPPNSSVPFPIGTSIVVRTVGIGATTLEGGVNVVLNGPLEVGGQNKSVVIVKVGTDEWDMFGNVTAGVTDTTPPAVISRATGSTTTIVVGLSEVSLGTMAGWSFKKNGATLTASGMAGSGTNSRTFTVPAMAYGDIVLASYNSATGDTLDAAGNEVVSFTDQAVTNNIPNTGGGPLAVVYTDVTASGFVESPTGRWGNGTSSGAGAASVVMAGDGTYFAEYGSTANSGAVVGWSASAGIEQYGDVDFGVFVYNGDFYKIINGGASIVQPGIIQAGYLYGMRRSGTSIIPIMSSDGGTTWTAYSAMGTSSVALHLNASFTQSPIYLLNPKQTGAA